MKTKLLFAAVLMAASTGGAQAVWAGESRMLSSFSEVTGEATPLADVELPTPLAFYDFEGETEGIEFKADGIGTVPYSIPLSETEKGLSFTRNGNADNGYVQMANPFLNNSNIESQGATISLWVYLKDNSDEKTIWGFGQGAAGYEGALPKLSFSANTYFLFNHGVGNLWVDYNRNPNTKYIQTGQMAMATVVMGNGVCQLYVNGALVSDYPAQIQGANNLAERVNAIFPDMKAFPYFYLGKGSFDGTFSGHADKLGFYDKALTAEEVAALYEEQKVGYENPLDIDMDAREDVTNLIVNPQFTNTEDVAAGWVDDAFSYNSELSASDGLIVHDENNNWTGDFYQIIENVPNGLYALSAQVATRADWAVNLYCNDLVVGLGTKTSGTYTPSEVYSAWTDDENVNRVYVTNSRVTDGTLRIGVSKTNQRAGWVCFDNFRLEKASLNEVLALYGPVSINAQALDQSLLPDALKNLLNEALQKTPAEITVDAYTEAYLALQPVYDLCNYYVTNDILAYLTTCKSDLANSTGADDTALENAISALEPADWSTVTLEALQQAYNSLVEAHRAYQAAATPIGDHQFDMTYLLTNPDVRGYANGYVDGWFCDIEKSEFKVQNATPMPGETGINNYFECWSNLSLKAGWAMYQNPALPSGAYQLEAVAFATKASIADVTVGTTPKVALYAGDKRGDEVASSVLTSVGVYFLQTAAGTVKLGLKVEEGNTINWLGMNDMKLYKVAPKPVELTLNETEAYSVTADTYANVTLTRSLKADDKWNTFCVPFDMTAEQLTVNGISEVRRFSGVSTSGNSAILEAETVSDGVKAGVPYIVQVNSNVSEIEVDDVTVQAAAPTAQAIGYADAVGQVSITGNYSATTVPTGAYFISDNVFYVADAEANVTLNGFRAYITVEGGNEASQVNRLLIDIDGEVTAIEDVLGESAADSAKAVDVYTLSGVKVKSGVKKAEALDGLQRGIYIVDGQKMTK